MKEKDIEINPCFAELSMVLVVLDNRNVTCPLGHLFL
jgi:hypothetical protein